MTPDGGALTHWIAVARVVSVGVDVYPRDQARQCLRGSAMALRGRLPNAPMETVELPEFERIPRFSSDCDRISTSEMACGFIGDRLISPGLGFGPTLVLWSDVKRARQ